MWTITDACATALKRSHTKSLVMELYDSFGVLRASTYSNPRLVATSDGEVVVDRTAVHTRSFSGTVVDPDGALTSGDRRTLLDPLYRPQLAISVDVGWRAPLTGEAAVERVPLGRFVLDEVGVEELGDHAVLQLSGVSAASALIADNAWSAPYTPPAGTYSEAIAALLNDRASNAGLGWLPALNLEGSSTALPQGLTIGGDGRSNPWDDARKLAEADGKELLTDAAGNVVLRSVPTVSPGATPVWEYSDDSGTRLAGLRRSISAQNVYNGVIMTASAPWLIYPVQSVVWDTSVSSPTYYLGQFGKKPLEVSDAMVASQAQCDSAAAAKLKSVLGVAEDISFAALSNPAHEPGDIVRVASSAAGVDSLALLDKFSIPFDVRSPMRGTIRRQRLA